MTTSDYYYMNLVNDYINKLKNISVDISTNDEHFELAIFYVIRIGRILGHLSLYARTTLNNVIQFKIFGKYNTYLDSAIRVPNRADLEEGIQFLVSDFVTEYLSEFLNDNVSK